MKRVSGKNSVLSNTDPESDDQGIVVMSSIPLSPVQLKEIKNRIDEIFHLKLPVKNILVKDLIGGIKIKVKDWVFDGSLSRDLSDLKSDLLN